MVAKRGHQQLAVIGHRFIAKKKKEIKNTDARVWGDTRGDQKPETFFGRPCLQALISIMTG